MARLPQPGGDNGNWGIILNEYLSRSLKDDGSLKDAIVTTSSITASAITSSTLADSSVTTAKIAQGSITEPLLDTSVQTKLNGTPPQLLVIPEVDYGPGVASDTSGLPTCEVQGDMVRLLGYVFVDVGSLVLTESAKLFSLPPSVVPTSARELNTWTMLMSGTMTTNTYYPQSIYMKNGEVWMAPIAGSDISEGIYLYLSGFNWRIA